MTATAPRRLAALCLTTLLPVAGCDEGSGDGRDTDAGEDSIEDSTVDGEQVETREADAEADSTGDGDVTDVPTDGPVDEPTDGPVPARSVVVDPDNPRWLEYSDGSPFFLCGPGDPEDFLYRGSRNTDGTRSGDQLEIIDKLRGTGANSIYLQVVRSHGGDGDGTHNPFIDNDPARGISSAILDQWESWLTAMDEAGIVAFFIFYDDSARIWDSGDDVEAEERLFLEAVVDRFEHHGHLIWVVAEEYQERYSAARVSNIAAVIAAADERDHPIAVHKLDGLDFSELADDPAIDQFAIQDNVGTADELHLGMVSAWGAAAGRYNLNMAEAAGYGNGETARRKSWAVAMGGAYVMALGWDVVSTPLPDLRDCGTLRAFLEAADFSTLAPQDELAWGGTRYVLAAPGVGYILYSDGAAENPGLRSMAAGTYDLVWLDIPSGTTLAQEGVVVPGGDTSWPRPAGIGAELALHIARVPGP